MDSVSAGTISACVIALAILIALVAITWIKWRRSVKQKANNPEDPSNYENPTLENQDMEMQGVKEEPTRENLALKLKSMENITGSSTLVNEKTEEDFYSRNAHHSPRSTAPPEVYYPKEHTRSSKIDLFSRDNKRSSVKSVDRPQNEYNKYGRSQELYSRDRKDDVFDAYESKPRSKSEAVYSQAHAPPPSYGELQNNGMANHGSEAEDMASEPSRRLSTYL